MSLNFSLPRQWSSTFLAPGTGFVEDSFSMDGGGGGMVWGQFKGITFMVHFIFNLGEGNGNPLQHSCLENPMDGGAWWATVHGVAKSRTQLSDFTFTL